MSSHGESVAGFSIAPPLIILLVIIAAIVSVVIAASLYRICRTMRGVTDEEEGNCNLNPNKRSAGQLQRMEEVRWINNMYAWQQAKIARADEIHEQRRTSGLRRPFEERRARNRVSWTHFDFPGDDLFAGGLWCDVFEISADEFLDADHLSGNPYRDMLQQRYMEREEAQARRPRPLSEEPSSQTSLPYSEPAREASPQASATQDEVIEPETQLQQASVTITLNDGTEDITGDGLNSSPYQYLYPVQMPRSSSIYSGDVLSPSRYQGSVQNSPNSLLQPPVVDAFATHPAIEQ